MKKFACLALVLFAAGCAKPNLGSWDHRINNGRAMQKDRAECAAQAGQAGCHSLWQGLYNDCMCGRGYSSGEVTCEK